MSTYLGNIAANCGQKYNFTISNLTGESLHNSNDLLENTLIVAAPTDIANHDAGTYSLFITDPNGTAVRLTYTIQPGNGLVIGRNGDEESGGAGADVISMSIDDYTIKTNPEKSLYVQAYNIIDSYTLTANPYGAVGDYISVVTSNLDKATNNNWGVVRSSDPATAVNISDGEVSIITDKLQYVDDDLNLNGIVRCQSDDIMDLSLRTVEAQNGRLRVITKNLDKATLSSVGVIKPDGTTTSTDINGNLTVIDFAKTYSYIQQVTTKDEDNNDVVTYITYYTYGIVRPDNITTYTYTPGVFTVITDGLQHADPSTYTFGTVMPDPESMVLNTYGYLAVNRYNEISAILRDFTPYNQAIWNVLYKYENRIAALEAAAAAEHVYSFVCVGSEITTLTEPYWDQTLNDGNGGIVDIEQEFSVVFSISTNCKFSVAVEFEDNKTPAVTLQSVKFGSDVNVDGSGLSSFSFDSTGGNESTLKFSFRARNYNENTNASFITTKVTFIVTSINTASVYKKGIHTFIRWNQNKYIHTTAATTTPLPTIYPKDPDPELISYVSSLYAVHTADISSVVYYGSRGSSDLPFTAVTYSYQTRYTDSTDETGTVTYYYSYMKDIVLNDTADPTSLIVDIQYYKPSYLIAAVPIAKSSNVAKDTTATTTILTNAALGTQSSSNSSDVDFLTDSLDNGLIIADTSTSFTKVVDDPTLISTANGLKLQGTFNLLEYTSVRSWAKDNDASWLTYNISTTYGVNGTYNVLHLCSTTGILDDRCAYVTITTNNTDEAQHQIASYYTEQYAEMQPSITITANMNNAGDPLTFTATRSAHSRIVGDTTTTQYWGVDVTFNYVSKMETTTSLGTTASATSNMVMHGINATPTTIHLQGSGSELSVTRSYDMGSFENYVGTNTLSTIRITNIESSSFTYVDGPQYTYNICGIWQARNNVTKTFTFGDASISSMTISKWDDAQLVLQFTIVPGLHTSITTGASISEVLNSGYGDRNIKFVCANNTYDWSFFYTYCDFYATEWTSLGCTVTYRFWNQVSDTQTADTPNANIIYRLIRDDSVTPTASNALTIANNTSSSSVTNKFTSQNYEHVPSLVQNRTLTSASSPILPSINYIKFWFDLEASYVDSDHYYVSRLNFITTLNGSLSRYGWFNGVNYSTGATLSNIGLTNGLYLTPVTSTLDDDESDNKSVNNLVSYMSRISNIVDSIQSQNTTGIENLI